MDGIDTLDVEREESSRKTNSCKVSNKRVDPSLRCDYLAKESKIKSSRIADEVLVDKVTEKPTEHGHSDDEKPVPVHVEYPPLGKKHLVARAW